LEWALKLERAGISGEGMSFNKDERERAHAASTTINIGSIGSMVGNLGSQNKSGAISASGIAVDQVKTLTEQLKPHIAGLESAGADSALMKSALSELLSQTSSSQPDSSAMRAALVDLRNALSGAAGSLIASGAIAMIVKILGGCLWSRDEPQSWPREIRTAWAIDFTDSNGNRQGKQFRTKRAADDFRDEVEGVLGQGPAGHGQGGNRGQTTVFRALSGGPPCRRGMINVVECPPKVRHG
jgi:hypothetical protein